MFAVVTIAGTQEKVSEGDVLQVPHLEAKAGETVTFGDVLLVVKGEDVSIGSPTVAGASVEAKVLEHGRSEKVRVVKFKRRKRYSRTKGHRQEYTEVEVTKITAK
jgi:large subunit ribosomal protein L21